MRLGVKGEVSLPPKSLLSVKFFLVCYKLYDFYNLIREGGKGGCIPRTQSLCMNVIV